MKEQKEYIDAELKAISRKDFEPNELYGLIERAKNLVDYIATIPNYLSELQDAYVKAVERNIILLYVAERHAEAVIWGKTELDKLHGVDHIRIGYIMGRMSVSLAHLGEREEAVDYLHRSSLLFEANGGELDKVIHLFMSASVLNIFDTPSSSSISIEYTLKALNIAKTEGYHAHIIIALSNLIHYSNQADDYDNAIKYGENLTVYYEQVIQDSPDIKQRHDVRRSFAYAHNNLGQAWLGKDRPDKAEHYFQLGLALNKQLDNTSGEQYSLQGLGSVKMKYGDYLTAISHFQSALKIAEEIEGKFEISQCCHLLAEAFEASGDDKQALHYYRRFHELSRLLHEENAQLSYQRLQTNHHLEVSRELNEQLEEKNRLLHRAYNEQDELLKIVAHDLKNPLTATSIQLDLASKALQREDSEKVAVFLSRTDHSIQFMNEIVDQLRKLIVVEDDSVEVAHDEIDLVPLVQSTIERNAPGADSKQIIIDFIAPEKVMVASDERILGQVFDNLLANSIKYSNPLSSVVIKTETDEQSVLIDFVDNGVGISADEMGKLFTKFGRLPSSKPTNNESSIGLGLYIAKKQLAKFNGTLRASSPGIGKGSTFSVELPLILC